MKIVCETRSDVVSRPRESPGPRNLVEWAFCVSRMLGVVIGCVEWSLFYLRVSFCSLDFTAVCLFVLELVLMFLC